TGDGGWRRDDDRNGFGDCTPDARPATRTPVTGAADGNAGFRARDSHKHSGSRVDSDKHSGSGVDSDRHPDRHSGCGVDIDRHSEGHSDRYSDRHSGSRVTDRHSGADRDLDAYAANGDNAAPDGNADLRDAHIHEHSAYWDAITKH